MLPQSKEFVLPLIKKVHIAKDTYSFYFDRTTEEFDFLPGQYVRMSFPLMDGAASRFFTIASNPLDKKYLVITTKAHAISSEFKQTLVNVSSNEKVKFFGPIGGFYLDDSIQTERVFLAGGIGITPFYSMIIYAAQKNLRIPLTLIVSFSTLEEAIYYEELTKIAKEHAYIKIIYTITYPHKSWKGETSRISQDLIKKYVPTITNPIYSIVGSPEMVNDTEEMLEKMGVGLEKIKIELFTGY